MPRRRLTNDRSQDEEPAERRADPARHRRIARASRDGIREVLDRAPEIEIVAQVQCPIRRCPSSIPPPRTSSSSTCPGGRRRGRGSSNAPGAPDSPLVVLGARTTTPASSRRWRSAQPLMSRGGEPAELVRRSAGSPRARIRSRTSWSPGPTSWGGSSTTFAKHHGRPGITSPLTIRGLEILALVAGGLRNREIAQTLAVSDRQ